jgi:hypothetical protein
LHAFIASLYELFLLAAIRFLIQPTIWAIIWRLLIVGGLVESIACACIPTNTTPVKAIAVTKRFMGILRHLLRESLGVSVIVKGILHPAYKIEYESDDEYRSETDIHKNLRRYFRLLIAAETRHSVGTLPHLTQLSLESLFGAAQAATTQGLMVHVESDSPSWDSPFPIVVCVGT